MTTTGVYVCLGIITVVIVAMTIIVTNKAYDYKHKEDETLKSENEENEEKTGN